MARIRGTPPSHNSGSQQSTGSQQSQVVSRTTVLSGRQPLAIAFKKDQFSRQFPLALRQQRRASGVITVWRGFLAPMLRRTGPPPCDPEKGEPVDCYAPSETAEPNRRIFLRV